MELEHLRVELILQIQDAVKLYKRLATLGFYDFDRIAEAVLPCIVENKKFYVQFLLINYTAEQLAERVWKLYIAGALYGLRGDRRWSKFCEDIVQERLGKEKSDG